MQQNSEPQDFIHPNLDQEFTAIAGHYVFNKERRMSVDGRDVLYLVGYAVVDTSCCGLGGCAYALVPGYVQEWKYKKKNDGMFVSLIEPIHNTDEQQKIRDLIEKREVVQQVTFSF